VTCPRCGAEPPEGARFCPSCGLDLSAGPREERKFVSILFVDMVGSTEQADGADPEDVRERNQLYYDEVRGRIEKHGGTVEKYIGDAVLAVFGAPLASADDAERAVAASRSVLEGSTSSIFGIRGSTSRSAPPWARARPWSRSTRLPRTRSPPATS
jgi:zinc-ribbon domain/Adenylate and Guanylate cyclase catalytic domain